MTVQQLIDRLQKAKNKDAPVYVATYDEVEHEDCEVLSTDDCSPLSNDNRYSSRELNEFWLLPRWSRADFPGR